MSSAVQYHVRIQTYPVFSDVGPTQVSLDIHRLRSFGVDVTQDDNTPAEALHSVIAYGSFVKNTVETLQPLRSHSEKHTQISSNTT